MMTPPLKWVGGKRQLLPTLMPLLPSNIETYIEPFVGGGALLLALLPKKAIVNDSNIELINVYNVIKTNVDALITTLQTFTHNKETFYTVRQWDRLPNFYNNFTAVQRAARFIFLNKTAFNGLYRVNKKGQFNVPFGRYTNPKIVNIEELKAVSAYLNNNSITLSYGPYQQVLQKLTLNSFVYFDPPYYPVSTTANFTSYTQKGFNPTDHLTLKENCDALTAHGIKFMLSNSAAPFIKNLYQSYTITEVEANRAINSKATARGKITELVITNY